MDPDDVDTEPIEDSYTYFVSFAHTGGFGCAQLVLPSPVTSFDDVQDMRDAILANNRHLSDLSIVNFQRLGAHI